MFTIRNSSAFEGQKNEFIARHNENPRIKYAIKSLLGDLGKEEVPEAAGIGVSRVRTNLGIGRNAYLACYFFIIPEREEIAPVYLFFPDEMAKTPVDDTDMPEVLKAVLEELGWLEPTHSQPFMSIPSSGTPT